MNHNHLDKEPLISIVVPVFNVEKYIERCILSLVSQSYKNIEIIMVNDGSTDESGEICNRYKEIDSRIKVVHKSNGGLSDARNIGIKQARGEYIAFVDSDDWVEKDYIAEMYWLMLQTDSDIVTCGFKRTSIQKTIKNIVAEVDKIYLKEEAIKLLLYQKISTSAWGKLYKINLWSGIQFPVGILYEDVETIYAVFNKCKKVVSTNKILYFYYFRNDSIVNQKFSIKKMDYVENCRKLLETVKSDYPQFENAAISRLVWAEIHVLVHMDAPMEYPYEYKMLTNDVKNFRSIVIKDRKNKLKMRFVAILSCLGIRTLRGIFRLT